MYEITYKASVERNWFAFLRGLAKITPFYNFSGLNDVTTNKDNYIDPSHYSAYIGDMIIECMCNNKRYEGLYDDGFGMYITEDNIDALIDVLERNLGFSS